MKSRKKIWSRFKQEITYNLSSQKQKRKITHSSFFLCVRARKDLWEWREGGVFDEHPNIFFGQQKMETSMSMCAGRPRPMVIKNRLNFLKFGENRWNWVGPNLKTVKNTVQCFKISEKIKISKIYVKKLDRILRLLVKKYL
jgi:hypothetical protein